jgi:ferredoxin-NADP reductase
MKTYSVPVLEVVQETPRDRTLALEVPEDARELFRFHPGQFLTVRDPAWHSGVKRAYSLTGSPTERGVLRLTIRDDGKMGRHLYERTPGARIETTLPQGKFLLDVPADRPLVLAAGGAGVGPFRGFLRALRESDGGASVTLLASARTAEETLFRVELERLASERPWFTYLPTLTREPAGTAWTGRRGRVDALLFRSTVHDPAHTIVYTCGPTVFVEAIVRFAHAAGLPDAHVRREKWG